MSSAESIAHSPETSTDIEKNRDVAAFSYILIFAPILLVTRRDSRFIQHHSLQALYLGFFFVLFILLPGKLSYLNILVLAGALMGFLEAQAGHYYRLPVIADLVVRKVTLQSAWEKLKHSFLWLCSVIKRIFTNGPGFAIRGTSEAIQKVRGIDALKVNGKVENLKKEVSELQEKVNALEKKMSETSHES